MTLTVGSLFSGIGGLDLGLERAGMRVLWQSEIDPYASKVLAKHWPEVPNYGDIKKIDWQKVEPVEVICGGYPCQPFSTAGKRRGEEDPRHLWPWVRLAISALRPRYAILENVRGHLSMGGSTVIGDLASVGYDAEWRVISAAGLGAPHRRDRIFIVAYSNSSNAPYGGERPPLSEKDRSRGNDRGGSGSDSWKIRVGSAGKDSGYVADADDARGGTPEYGVDHNGTAQIEERQNLAQFGISRRGTDMADTDSRRRQKREPETKPLSWTCCGGEREFVEWWETEPDVGRVANGIPSRVDRLKGLGNAVVPQVAEYVGRLVLEHYESANK